jgi:hypothetical protein
VALYPFSITRARKGRPEKIFSDNGKTFVATAKWLKRVRNNEKFNNWLAKQDIKWKFNLSRAPWWDGTYTNRSGMETYVGKS